MLFLGLCFTFRASLGPGPNAAGQSLSFRAFPKIDMPEILHREKRSWKHCVVAMAQKCNFVSYNSFPPKGHLSKTSQSRTGRTPPG